MVELVSNNFCNNLNQLLSDICTFLKQEGAYKKLSSKARRQADELLERSKQQLHEITKIQSKIQPPIDQGDEYVVMDPTKSTPEEHEGIYSDVTESSVNNNDVILTRIPTISSGPYADLPAKDMNRNIKCGYLILKTRTIFGFEKKRKVLAGVHEDWFLCYATEKDLKPMHLFNMNALRAEQFRSKNNKNMFDFQLSTAENKSYLFSALSLSDMVEWIEFINKWNCNGILKVDKEPEVPTWRSPISLKRKEEVYDIPNKIDDLERIYQTLEPSETMVKVLPVSLTPPDLPSRLKNGANPLTPRLTRCLPPVPKSRSPEPKTFVSVHTIPIEEDSFSESDTSENYEIFIVPQRTESPLLDESPHLPVKQVNLKLAMRTPESKVAVASKPAPPAKTLSDLSLNRTTRAPHVDKSGKCTEIFTSSLRKQTPDCKLNPDKPKFSNSESNLLKASDVAEVRERRSPPVPSKPKPKRVKPPSVPPTVSAKPKTALPKNRCASTLKGPITG